MNRITRALARNKSILLLGARQAGKTTLVKSLDSDLYLSFARPKNRQYYEQDPERLANELEALADKLKKKPLVILDEVQKVPSMMDLVQDLIDNNSAQFILTGSSIRKLKKSHDQSSLNLLPGRVVKLQLDPLNIEEMAGQPDLSELILFGGLPGIYTLSDSQEKEEDLESYVTTYLEEEVRLEALVRDMAPFNRFLELAANESGRAINFSKLSQDIGVSHPTIAGYFQILQDCLMIERIEPITSSPTRRVLTKAPKFIFSDLGIRRTCAREGVRLPPEYMGNLFEQFVGLQLIQNMRAKSIKGSVKYWRAANGQEVDWVIVKENQYIPIEVKWTHSPNSGHTKHLHLFMEEYDQAKHAYIVCRVERRQKLHENVTAIPWQEIIELLDAECGSMDLVD